MTRTTLLIPDPLFRALKRRAAEQGRTLSSVVAECLRKGLADGAEPRDLPPLPTFSAGRPRVDLTNREALYNAMEDE